MNPSCWIGVGSCRRLLQSAVVVALLASLLVLGAPDVGALPGAAASTDPMPTLCSHAATMSGGKDPRFAEVFVSSGATVTFRAVDIRILPSRYFGNGRGEFWYYARVLDASTMTQLTEKRNLANIDVVWHGGPYVWVDPDGANHRTIGTWTNTTGSDQTFLVEMRAVRTFAGADTTWKLEATTAGGSGSDGPVCATERLRRGPNARTVGYAEDPVNTYTGSFTDSFTDLESPTGVFGLEWSREYDSGGVVGDPLWGYSFSERIQSGPSGSRELVEPSGRVVRFESNGSGGFLRGRDFDGTLAADGSGWKLTFPDGSTKSFSSAGVMTGRASWDGQTVSATWTSGKLELLTSSLGPTLDPAYDGSGRLVSVEASDGREVSYGYDANGFLDEVVRPGAVTWAIENDTSGQVTRIEDPTGRTKVDNVYDEWGRVTSQVSHTGAETTFAYSLSPRSVVVTDVETSTATTYTYDADGRIASVQDSLGNSALQSFDSYDLPVGSTSRGGGTVAIDRDAAGRVEEITRTGEAATTVTYVGDGSGRVASVTDANGTTSYTYDGAERLPSTVTDPLSHTTTYDIVGGLVAAATDPDGVTVEYRYDSLRRLVESEDELGNITSYEYDTAGRRTAVESPSGARTETTYDAAGRPSVVTAADGGETTTTYDAAGRVTSVEDPTGAVTSYTYETVSGLLSTMTDPLSRVTSYTYDAIGQLTRTTFGDATYVETDYGHLGRVLAERDELGRETTFAHDVDGNVTTTEDPAGGVVETTYDAAGRVETETDALGRDTTYAYDPDTGLVDTVTAPTGATSYTYDDLGRVVTVTDPRGGVTTTAYTPGGRTDTVTDPVGLVTDYGYDAAGRTSTVTAPGGHVTTYGYDTDSRVTSVTSPEGDVTATTYDMMGRVLTVTDPAGVVTTNTWSLRGELLTQATSGAGTVEFSYDAAGQLSWVDDALDHRSAFTYDARGRELTRTDANAQVWSTAWNAAGEKVSETDPLNRTTSYTYDPAGRVATVADPSGRTITNTWLADGRLDGWSATDGTTALAADFGYDTAGRRSTATLGGRTWNYSYTTAGDLALVVDPDGRALGYSYDAAGRRTSLRQANGRGVTYSYDSSGRVSAITPTETAADTFTGPNGRLPDTYTWNSIIGTRATLGIQSNAAYLTVGAPNGSTATLSSKLANSTGGDTTLTYKFDSASTPTPLRIYQSWTSDSETYRVQITANSSTASIFKTVGGTTTTLGTFTVPVGTDAYKLRFRQDGNQLKAKAWAATDPEPSTWGAEVTDSSGPITAGKPRIQLASGSGANNGATIDNWTHQDLQNPPTALVGYTWDDDGRLVGEDLPGSSQRTWTWDDGQLVEFDQTAPGATTTSALDYDTAGRLDTETIGSDVTEWAYDPAGQLLSETLNSTTTAAWTYDNLGRRATETTSAGTTTHTYDNAGQLTLSDPPSGSNATYTYDNAGRRTGETPSGGGTISYTYNPAGQLDTYTAASGETQTRRYDPDGSPDTLTNTISGVTRTWTLDWDHTTGLAELTAITNQSTTGSAVEVTNLARTTGTPWATASRGPDHYTMGSDSLGSTVETTGNNVARSTDYDPWGTPSGTGTLNPKLGYRGELTNKALLHLRARNYQPATAAFLTTDPLDGVNATPVTNNPYHYANNNPTNSTDPSGLRPDDGDYSFASGFFAFAGYAALADGPLPGPGDVIALAVVTALAVGVVGVFVHSKLAPAPSATLDLPSTQQSSKPSRTRDPVPVLPNRDDRSADHRGRLQVQGQDVPNEDRSWSWAQPSPPTAAEGIFQLHKLRDELSGGMLHRRSTAFRDAEIFILNCAAGGGCPPMDRTKSFRNIGLPKRFDEARVDIQIFTGRAFV